jgi:hypothetical protein
LTYAVLQEWPKSWPAWLGRRRLVQSQLFGLQPYDPATLAAAIIILMAMAFPAAYVPAARASRIDPMTALRYE